MFKNRLFAGFVVGVWGWFGCVDGFEPSVEFCVELFVFLG